MYKGQRRTDSRNRTVYIRKCQTETGGETEGKEGDWELDKYRGVGVT